MPWFRLDDSFHSHPKVIAAGNEAVGLFVRCGTYAAEHLTDGFISEDIAVLYGASDTGSRRNPGTGKPETLAETLVRTKLWRRTRGGWRMPDYLEYNPSAKAVGNERKNAAQRQKRRREALTSRRDSRSDNSVSHTAPTRPLTNTALSQPEPFLRAREDKSNFPDVKSNSQANRLPSARPLGEALRDAGIEPGHQPATDQAKAAAVAQARQGLNGRTT